MSIQELPGIGSFSGNAAIDVALITIIIMSARSMCERLSDVVRGCIARRRKTIALREVLKNSSAHVRSLNEQLHDARQRTHNILGPYYEELEDRLAVAIASMNKQRDPDFAALEEQLANASNRERLLMH